MTVVGAIGIDGTTGVTPAAFREACGQFATGVTIVTVRDGSGARGMTANSFTSVSLDPPLVLISVDNRNQTHRLLETHGRFAVSVLAEAHRPWSDRFAGRRRAEGDGQSRFDDIPHRLTPDGLPIIRDSLASFACRVVATHSAGDHSLFIGLVEQVDCSPDHPPLLFHRGGYPRAQGAHPVREDRLGSAPTR